MKFLKFLLLILLVCFTFCSCSHDRGLILFNSEPVTRENVLHDSKAFNPGQKIYYLFIAPKKMNNEFIRVQIFKMTDKAHLGGADVLRTKDYRLMKDERYYHSDYFALYESGRYVMQIFSHDDFLRPLALNDFYIK